MEANNTKARREALEAIWKEVYFYAIEEDKQDFAHLQEAMLEDPPEYKDLRNSFFTIAHLVDAALSAPARNCEEYDCKSDAEVGFVEQTGETDANPLYWQLFANWLFAPAAERKGATA